VEIMVLALDTYKNVAGLNEIPLFQWSTISRLSQLTSGHIWVGFRKHSYAFVLSLQSPR
jgi:hypothetical protein